MLKNKNLIPTLFFVILIFLLAIYNAGNFRFIFKGIAASDEVNIRIQLQGEYEKIANPKFKTKVLIYSDNLLIKEIKDVILTKDRLNFFKLNIDLTGFDLTKKYSIFIKPDKYLGKFFCSSSSYIKNCTKSEIIFNTGTNNLELIFEPFFSGDISPADGKITAEDISKIINSIGDETTDYLATDINSDNRVETVDYSLALYSLSKNYTDDAIPVTNNATPTLAPSVIPSSIPSLTPTIVANSPTPTTIPNQSGTCKAVVNGNIYVKSIIKTYCSPINNESTEMCVSSAEECNVTKCVDEIIKASKVGVDVCAGGWGTLDEAASRATLKCQVEFVPGPCTPTPTPPLDCSTDGPSC